MVTTSTTDLSTVNTADLATAIGSYIAIILIALLIAYLIQSLLYMFIFKKADVPGWAAWIPIWREIVLFKDVIENMGYFVFIFVGSFIASILSSVASMSQNSTVALIVGLLALAAAVATIIVSIKSYHSLSLHFGYGVGMTLVLIFLNFIGECILAFGSAEWISDYNEENIEQEIV